MAYHIPSWEIMGDSDNGLAEFHTYLLMFLLLQQLQQQNASTQRFGPWIGNHRVAKASHLSTWLRANI